MIIICHLKGEYGGCLFKLISLKTVERGAAAAVHNSYNDNNSYNDDDDDDDVVDGEIKFLFETSI